MSGIAQPGDLYESIMSAQKIEQRDRQISKMAKGRRIPPSFEQVLMKHKSAFMGSEGAIMKALDHNRDEEDRQKYGWSKKGPLDWLISSKTAQAVGQLYGRNSAKKTLNLQADDPFSPSAAVSQANTQMQDLLKSFFPEAATPDGEAMFDGMFGSKEVSAAAGIAEMTRTIPPRLAKHMGFGRAKPNPLPIHVKNLRPR